MDHGHAVDACRLLGARVGHRQADGHRGSEGRHAATGRGIATVAVQALNDAGIDPAGATVAVQGFGQVGSNTAQLLAAAGLRVVAVSDSRGGVHSDGGLDLDALTALKEEGGALADYGGAEH